MGAKRIMYDFQKQFLEIFNAQDPESEDLDTVFDIGGKKLYANKSRLTVVSPTFKSMLAKRWTSKNDEPIQINEYKFEDFKDFLTFIYSGECKLTDENIFDMIDMAEFFGVQIFKNICENHLLKMEITIENVFSIMETSNTYSLVHVKNLLVFFVVNKFDDIVKCEKFLDSKKSIVENFVTLVQNDVEQEEIFQAIYKWSEHQARKKRNESIQDNFNLNDAIKTEIAPLLQYIHFNEMSLGFLVKYVVKKSFLFSGDELSEILDKAIHDVKVKVTNTDGQAIFGSLPYDSEVIKVIKTLKNLSSDNAYNDYIYWETYCKLPSTSCQINKKDGVEWYLTYDTEADLCVVPQKLIKTPHYLLAEMTLESSEFKVTEDCKIEIC